MGIRTCVYHLVCEYSIDYPPPSFLPTQKVSSLTVPSAYLVPEIPDPHGSSPPSFVM